MLVITAEDKGVDITSSAVSFCLFDATSGVDVDAPHFSTLGSICHTRRGSGFQPEGTSGIGNLHRAR
jgi:hypothetical protein